MKLETDIDSLGISLDTLMLSPDGGEVAAHIAAMLQGSIWGGGGGSRVAPVIKCVLRVPWAWGSRS